MEAIRKQLLNWGIIGAGNVTEKKSGPAFNKVAGSRLCAIMRRDAKKAKDYARRHGVPRWYDNAEALLNDTEINAIYIATPPDAHFPLAVQALELGKPVYLEKPMTLNGRQAAALEAKVAQTKGKLVVAHYRRAQPYFLKIKQLLDEGVIGNTRMVSLRTWHPGPTQQELSDPGIRWRLDPERSGGGLFHDLAPHQLDLMLYFFGVPETARGQSKNQLRFSAADDIVSAQMVFRGDIMFSGSWIFQAPRHQDVCEILGSKGSIRFSVFEQSPVVLTTAEGEQYYDFPSLEHVQQPMIEAVTRYFRSEGENPCDVAQGRQVMHLMDVFTI